MQNPTETTEKTSKSTSSSEYNTPNKLSPPPFLLNQIYNPIWLSVSESAKICGVNAKTIRRALQTDVLKFKIIKDRYSIDFSSLIQYILKQKKLKNKLESNGLGQYITGWKK